MYYVVLAILAAGCPDKAAFMADEPTMVILQQNKLKYSASEYMEYIGEIKKICKALNQNAAGKQNHFTEVTSKLTSVDDLPFTDDNWTLHKVELTIWTLKNATELCPEIVQN